MALGCRFVFFSGNSPFFFICVTKQAWSCYHVSLNNDAFQNHTHHGHTHLPGKESVCYENKPKLCLCLSPLLLVCRTPWVFFWLHNTVFSCLFLRQRAEREPFSLCSLFRLISLCPVVSDFFLKHFSQKFAAFNGDCDDCSSIYLFIFVSFHS